MTPATVLLDRSFLVALTDVGHPSHPDVVGRYRHLLDLYERGDVRLRARHDHLDQFGDGHDDLIAPLETIHVATQFRRQARRLELPFAVDDDTAVTFVVMRRESIDRIATLDPRYEQLEVALD